MSAPLRKPKNPCFSSGPAAKRPGWQLAGLKTRSLSRSHRAAVPKSRLAKVIDESRRLLGIPDDFLLGIVPGSDTGAVELAMWNLLGPRGVDVLFWESFGKGWMTDLTTQLRLDDVRVLEAPYGALPDLGQVDWQRDVVFTWNGTTSGVRVPNADWIAEDRAGLAICDATSAVFAMPLDYSRLDAVTWSWQKVLGGEAAHGMLALSPKAVQRLETWRPPWPLPKLFRITRDGRVDDSIFSGATINTPSMLAVEDHLDALAWADSIGGLPALVRRSEENLAVVSRWVEASSWVDFLARDPACRSTTAICLDIKDPWFTGQSPEGRAKTAKALVDLLEAEGVAYDTGSYRDAPPGLRLWGGATVEADDMAALLPWLDYAWQSIRKQG